MIITNYNSESGYLIWPIPNPQLPTTAALNVFMYSKSQNEHCLTWISFPFAFPLLCVNWEHGRIHIVISEPTMCTSWVSDCVLHGCIST